MPKILRLNLQSFSFVLVRLKNASVTTYKMPDLQRQVAESAKYAANVFKRLAKISKRKMQLEEKCRVLNSQLGKIVRAHEALDAESTGQLIEV